MCQEFPNHAVNDSCCNDECAKDGTCASDGIAIARLPSPICRILNDLEAELVRREISPDAVTTLCDRLLNNLRAHYKVEETAGALKSLDRIDAGAHNQVEECFGKHQETLTQATKLLRRARDERRDLKWQRDLNREFRSLRVAFNAQQRQEVDLVRRTCSLDVNESD